MKNLKSMRTFFTALSLIMCTIVVIYSASIDATYLGDVNEDGKVEPDDAQLITQFSVSLVTPTDRQKQIADIDQDGKITPDDARLALRMSVGMENLKELICTDSLSVGNYMQFNSKSWAVYSTKANAKSQNSKGIKKYLAKGDIISIKAIYDNVIKIGEGEFIYFTLNAQNYFAKVTVPTKITLNKTSASINIGNSITLNNTITPRGAVNNITWSSSDKSIATVNQSGVVKGIKNGTATITAKTINGKTATCKVTVKTPVVAVTGISLNKTSLSINVNDMFTLTATITPSNATNKKIDWSSDNPSVATVDSNGKIKGIKAGTANITAKSNNGKPATCKVTVKTSEVAVTGISLSATNKTVDISEIVTLSATITPSNATNKKVIWSSSDPSIATVNSNGTVIGLKANLPVKITAKTNNNKSATCTVTFVFDGDTYTDSFGRQFRIYKQNNPKWKNESYPGYRGTIGANGCCPTSISIICSGWGLDSDINPVRLCRSGRSYTGSDAVIETMGKNGFNYEAIYPWTDGRQLSGLFEKEAEIKTALKAGKKIIVRAYNGRFSGEYYSGGHFFTILGYNEKTNQYFFGDPITGWGGEMPLSAYSAHPDYIGAFWK